MAFRNPVTTLDASQITGTITDAQIAGIAAGKITGTITDAQIASIASGKISGQLTAAQIAAVNAANISGQLTSAQIASVAAVAVTGQLSASQIASLAANQISGQLTASQIAAVSAAAVTGQLAGTQLAADSIDGKTITGALVRTAASGKRTELGGNGGPLALNFFSGDSREVANGYAIAAPWLDTKTGPTNDRPQLSLNSGTFNNTAGTAATLNLQGGNVNGSAGYVEVLADTMYVKTPASGGLFRVFSDATVNGALTAGATTVNGSLSLNDGTTTGTLTAPNFTDSGWLNLLSYQTGFAAAGSGAQVRLKNGVIRMRGNITWNSSGAFTRACQLPAGYWPPNTYIYPVATNTTTAQSLQIGSDGWVSLYASAATAAYFPLNVVSYLLD